jgi:hypothetical protein
VTDVPTGPCPSCKANAKVVPFFERDGNKAKRLVLGADFERQNDWRLVCDACGADRTPPGARPPPASLAPARTSAGLASLGSAAWKTTSVLAMGLGALAVVAGIGLSGPAGIAIAIFGGLFGVGVGGVLWARGARSASAAKATLDASMEHAILDLAEKRGGRLLATDVARTLRLSLAEADRALTAMADGTRVAVEVGEDGIVTYDFREIRLSAERVQVRVDTSDAEAVEVPAETEVSRREKG